MSVADDNQIPNEENGSVWTSYSDLFMAIAVVFLIMFVFSMLAVGIGQFRSQVKVDQVLEYQIGKIPEKVLEQNSKDQDQLDKTVDEIQNRRQVLSNNIAALETLARDLKDQQQTIVRVQNDQLLKTEMLSRTREKNDQLEVELAHLDKERNQLRQQLKLAATNKLKLDAQIQDFRVRDTTQKSKITELSEVVKELEENIDSNERDIRKLRRKVDDAAVKASQQRKTIHAEKEVVAQLRADLDKTKEQLKRSHTESTHKAREIETMQERYGASREDNARLAEIAAKQRAKLDAQAEELKSRDGKISDLNKRVKDLVEDVGRLSGENAKVAAQLANAKSSFESAKRQQAELANQLQGQKDATDDALKELAAAKKDAARNAKAIGDAKSMLADKEDALKQAAEQSGKLQNMLGAAKKDIVKKAKKIHDLANRRQEIGGKLADALKNAGADVDVDPVSGVVTLRMDEALYFDNASYVLKPEGQEKIKKFIPVYAKQLFGDAQISREIASVTVTGHASPRYRRVYVDPFSSDEEAYTYNLSLSINRARAVTEFFFGEDVGDYPQREKLKSATSAAGMSYMHPIVAANEEIKEPCGTYDCALSRRVEINFLLKGNEPTMAH